MSLWWYDPLYSCNPFYDPLPTINLDPMESLLLPFDLPRNLVRTPSRTKMSRSEVVSDKEKFQVKLRVPHFNLNEISVKLVDNSLVVVAEHEEKPDETGHVSRRIQRRYLLPRNADFDNIQSTMSEDGVLTITAPKKTIKPGREREIAIEQLPSSVFSGEPKRNLQLLVKPEEKKTAYPLKEDIPIPVVHQSEKSTPKSSLSFGAQKK